MISNATVAFHYGRVALPPEQAVVGCPEQRILDQTFRWYFRDRPWTGSSEVYLVGVCPLFELVQPGQTVPTYDPVFENDLEGELKLTGFKQRP
jgi:hypothetical protein